MKKTDEYLKHAKDCRGLAKQMDSGEQRDQLTKWPRLGKCSRESGSELFATEGKSRRLYSTTSLLHISSGLPFLAVVARKRLILSAWVSCIHLAGGRSGVLREVQPMAIGTRLRSRGLRTHYRVRVPAAASALLAGAASFSRVDAADSEGAVTAATDVG